MPEIDWEAVRSTLVEAVRNAFGRIGEQKSGERFYAFALCSDEEAEGVCGSANTEEGFQARLKRNETYRKGIEERIAKHGMTWADYTNYFRWNLPEWAYHNTGSGDFRALDPLIPDPIPDAEEEPVESLDYRARLYGSMVLAMKDLDSEGFFGAGEQRDSVVLLCDLVEPPEKIWFAVESARVLNPPEVFQGFLKQWLSWLSPNDRETIDDPAAHSPIYRPLTDFLGGAL
jgi:hypothetical protein